MAVTVACCLRWLAPQFYIDGKLIFLLWCWCPSTTAASITHSRQLQPTNCDDRKNAEMCAYQAEAQPGVLPGGAYIVGHSIETSYISIQSWFPDGEQMDLAVMMADYWEEFGRTGAVAKWPLYNPDEDNVLVFQGPSLGGVRVENHMRAEQCAWMTDHAPYDVPPFASGSFKAALRRLSANATAALVQTSRAME